MPNPRCALLTVVAHIVGVVAIIACDRSKGVPPVDSIAAVPQPAATADSQPPPASSGWDPRVGSVLLVASERPEAAVVVFPAVQGEHAAAELTFDTAGLRGSTVVLISRAGEVGTATLGEGTTPAEEEECVGWPMLRVSSASGTPVPWSIGLVSARMTPVPLDSAGSLSAADSSTLVAEVTRLASTIPVREHAAQFRALPFAVQDVRRFRTATATDIIVARALRRVHEEANPLEERTVLIAERDSAQRRDPRGRYALAFYQRNVGREETLEGSEVLAALVHRGTSRPSLILARESEGGVRYSVLERTSPRVWRVRWTSALIRC